MNNVIDLEDVEDAIDLLEDDEENNPLPSLSNLVADDPDEAEWTPANASNDDADDDHDEEDSEEEEDDDDEMDEEDDNDGEDVDMELDEDQNGGLFARKTKRKRKSGKASSRSERYRNRRRKIAEIIDDDDLDDATIKARAAEQARMQQSMAFMANDMDDDKANDSLICLNPMADGCNPTGATGSATQPVFVHPDISNRLKKHQIAGARFLWSHIAVEPNGFGCVLADFMGLGKTLQVITTVQAFLSLKVKDPESGDLEHRYKHALILAPTICVRNWEAEVVKWLGKKEARRLGLRTLESSREKKMTDRVHVVRQWYKRGGLLIMGYELYRLLVLQSSGDEKIAPSNVVHTHLIKQMYQCLSRPGPDLIVLDEGHRVRDHKSKLVKALSHVQTTRRIILTGYPLQNHLEEYWTMVNFARPDYLGSLEEFKNRFVDPIKNGQCVDSSEADLRLARQRAYVLTRELKPLVLRRDQQYLFSQLPPKKEWVLICKLSDFQAQLYRTFLEGGPPKGPGGRDDVLGGYHITLAISNHPDVLYETFCALEREARNGNGAAKEKQLFGIEVDEELLVDDSDKSPPKFKARPRNGAVDNEEETELLLRELDGPRSSTPSVAPRSRHSGGGEHRLSFAEDLFRNYHGGQVDMSGKMLIFLALLKECQAIGDRVIVFSQSIPTLNTMEKMIALSNKLDRRAKKLKFLRIDGSTPQHERFRQIEQFNDWEEDVDLILISTKAGGEGINLCAGNRIIIFDVCWNPCNDSQSMCRSYRFGQVKPVFVYRFVSSGTMEKKVYDLQIRKEGVAKRIVDERTTERKFRSADLQKYFNLEDFEEAYAASQRNPFMGEADKPVPEEDVVLERVMTKFRSTLNVGGSMETDKQNGEETDLRARGNGGRWVVDWFEQETMFEEDLDQQCSPAEQEQVMESYRYYKAVRRLRKRAQLLSRVGMKIVQCQNCRIPNELFPQSTTNVPVPRMIECMYCKQPTSTANATEPPPTPVVNGVPVVNGAPGMPPRMPMIPGSMAVDPGNQMANDTDSNATNSRVLPPHLMSLYRQQQAAHEARERHRLLMEHRQQLLQQQLQAQQLAQRQRQQKDRTNMKLPDRHILVLRKGIKGCQSLKQQAEACGATMAIEVNAQLTDIVSAMSLEETLQWLRLTKLPRDVEWHDDAWLRAEITNHHGAKQAKQGAEINQTTTTAAAPTTAAKHSEEPDTSQEASTVTTDESTDAIELLDSEDDEEETPRKPTSRTRVIAQEDEQEDEADVIEII